MLTRLNDMLGGISLRQQTLSQVAGRSTIIFSVWLKTHLSFDLTLLEMHSAEVHVHM